MHREGISASCHGGDFQHKSSPSTRKSTCSLTRYLNGIFPAIRARCCYQHTFSKHQNHQCWDWKRLSGRSLQLLFWQMGDQVPEKRSDLPEMTARGLESHALLHPVTLASTVCQVGRSGQMLKPATAQHQGVLFSLHYMWTACSPWDDIYIERLCEWFALDWAMAKPFLYHKTGIYSKIMEVSPRT